MTLNEVKKTTTIIIKAINNEKLIGDAYRFGIEPGKKLDVVNIIPNGPFVLQFGEQQVAIGRELASSIDIEIVS